MEKRELEERLSDLELEVHDLEQELKVNERELTKHREKLARMEDLSDTLRDTLANLNRKAKVVSLPEYRRVTVELGRGDEMILKLRATILELEVKVHLAKTVLPDLQDEEAAVRRELGTWGQVVRPEVEAWKRSKRCISTKTTSQSSDLTTR